MKLYLLALTLCVSTFSLSAQESEKEERRGPPRQPPQEAFDACIDQTENDTVTFSGRRGEEISATCVYKDDQLVAVPTEHLRNRQQ